MLTIIISILLMGVPMIRANIQRHELRRAPAAQTCDYILDGFNPCGGPPNVVVTDK